MPEEIWLPAVRRVAAQVRSHPAVWTGLVEVGELAGIAWEPLSRAWHRYDPAAGTWTAWIDSSAVRDIRHLLTRRVAERRCVAPSHVEQLDDAMRELESDGTPAPTDAEVVGMLATILCRGAHGVASLESAKKIAARVVAATRRHDEPATRTEPAPTAQSAEDAVLDAEERAVWRGRGAALCERLEAVDPRLAARVREAIACDGDLAPRHLAEARVALGLDGDLAGDGLAEARRAFGLAGAG
jgi:hypothetical protein